MNNNAEKKKLTTSELFQVEQKLKLHEKSRGVAWILWVILGYFGGHRFYLGSYRAGIAKLVLSLLPFFLISLRTDAPYDDLNAVLGLFTMMLIGLSWLWTFIDAFLVENLLDSYNKSEELKIIQDILATRKVAN